MSLELFEKFRGQVLRTLINHGTAEPMNAGIDVPDYVHMDDPDFFVVADWWHDGQMFVMVECCPGKLTEPVIRDLAATCESSPGWAVAAIARACARMDDWPRDPRTGQPVYPDFV